MDGMLAEYAAGSLGDADRDRVAAHLATCARCRADHAAWRALAAADPGAGAPPDPDRLVHAVLTRSALDEPAAERTAAAGRFRRLRYLASVVRAEARLIRLAVPAASALVMALGVVLVLVEGTTSGTAPDPVVAGDLLAFVAPIVAAAGVAGVHRSRRDPAAELLAAIPASGRLLLLVRLALVFGFDLALALAASGVLAVTTDTGAGVAAGMNTLIATWLGPMALLSALSLLVAVRFGPDVALGTAVGVWALRMLAESDLAPDGLPIRLILAAWSTNAPVLVLSAALGVAAVVLAGRGGPFAGEPNGALRATHPM
jgi:hypothetical protein